MHWEDPQIRVVPVAGVSYRPQALDDPSFDPARKLTLVCEPDNPHDPGAVAIYNDERTLQLGYVLPQSLPSSPATSKRCRSGASRAACVC